MPCPCVDFIIHINGHLAESPTHAQEVCLCGHPYFRHEIKPSVDVAFQKGANPAHGCGGWIQTVSLV